MSQPRRHPGALSSSRAVRPAPTFFLIGAARAGTTSLYRWLARHPQIFMSPIKEPGYFARLPERARQDLEEDWVDAVALGRQLLGDFPPHMTSWEHYLDLFSGSGKAAARGEASAYLHYSDTAGRIRSVLPDSRIIVILRNPVDRAISQFRVFNNIGIRIRSIDQGRLPVIGVRPDRFYGWWDLREMGLYARQVREYLDAFGRERLLIRRFEDLTANSREVLSDICCFLGVAPPADGELTRSNASRPRQIWGLPLLRRRYPRAVNGVNRRLPAPLASKMRGVADRMLSEELSISQGERARLQEYYRSDLEELQRLLPELDFSEWLAP